MLWLLLTISFYFILAIVFLGDKYLLTGAVPKPEVYTFYVGISWALALVLIPFVHFYVPEVKQIIISFLAGALYFYGIFWFNKSLCKFEASRVVPAVGALSPIFTFLIVYFFSSKSQTLSFLGIIAFLSLISGSFIITLEKGKAINFQSLKNSFISALLFSLSFVLTKNVYETQSFWNGFIWTKLGGFLMAGLFFLFFKEVRKEVFKKRESFPKKTFVFFATNQSLGAVSNILQNFALAIVPLSYIAVIQALQGVQFVFLLLLTILLSFKFPNIIKEEISKEIITQKIVAILLIGVGIVILATV